MTTTGKKLKVVFVLILLSLSNILPVTAIAEAADNPTMLEIISAEITSDQSGKKALNVKLNANNNSGKKGRRWLCLSGKKRENHAGNLTKY